jgi:hypothetical protein
MEDQAYTVSNAVLAGNQARETHHQTRSAGADERKAERAEQRVAIRSGQSAEDRALAKSVERAQALNGALEHVKDLQKEVAALRTWKEQLHGENGVEVHGDIIRGGGTETAAPDELPQITIILIAAGQGYYAKIPARIIGPL